MAEYPRHNPGAGGTMGLGPPARTGPTIGPAANEPFSRGTEELLEQRRELVRRNPNDPAAHKSLAEFYLVGLGMPEEAIHSYKQVLSLKPDDPDTLQILGNLSISLRRLGEAQEFYGRLTRVEPWNTTARKSLESLSRSQGPVAGPAQDGKFKEAIRTVQSSVKEGNDHGVLDGLDTLLAMKSSAHDVVVQKPRTVSYAEIQRFVAANQLEKAAAALELYVEATPDHALAHNDLGVLYYRTGAPAKAQMHYERAVALDPDNAVFRKNLADFLYVEKGSLEEALKNYVQALNIQPKDVEALLALGHICADLKRPDDAEFFYKKALDVQPWNVTARREIDRLQLESRASSATTGKDEQYRRIQELTNAGKTTDAIAALKTFVAEHPEHAAAHNDLGVLCYREGIKDQPLREYQAATRLDPDNPTYQKNLADYLFVEEGKAEEALQIYVQLLKAQPRDPETLFGLAKMCQLLGRAADAKHFYEKTLELEPWNDAARKGLNTFTAPPSGA